MSASPELRSLAAGKSGLSEALPPPPAGATARHATATDGTAATTAALAKKHLRVIDSSAGFVMTDPFREAPQQGSDQNGLPRFKRVYNRAGPRLPARRGPRGTKSFHPGWRGPTQSVPTARMNIIRAWYRCCCGHTMRHLFTDAERFDSHEKDALPASEAGMSFLRTRTSKLAEVLEIAPTGLWPNVAITVNSSGLCFSVTGHSMRHLNWDGRLDLPFAPEVADQLAAVESNKPNADRAIFLVEINADVESAIRLLRLSYLIVDSKSPGMCS